MWQLWIDLETTGLDPETGRILEIGALAADPAGHPVGTFQTVVHCPLPTSRAMCPPEVWGMHTTSGLLDACQESRIDEKPAARLLHRWIDEQVPASEQLVLGGSGLCFDTAWMRHREWGLLDRAVYWHLDVGVLRRALHQAGVPWDPGTSAGPGKTHRAPDDALAHFNEWTAAMALLGTLA